MATAAVHGPEARGVLVPIYAQGHARAVATVRVERVFRDHRRMGFFRVKALPLVVAQGVQIEVREPAGATNLWAEFSAALQRLGGQRAVEARHVRLLLAGETTPRLEARRWCPATATDPTASLLEGVTLREDRRLLVLPQATATPDALGSLRLTAPGMAVVLDFSSGHFHASTTHPSGESP